MLAHCAFDGLRARIEARTSSRNNVRSLILLRAVREDQFLLSNLRGYADYIEGATYRLIPGVW